MLSDRELARVIAAARQIDGPYGHIVEVLALTGQRREEVARCTWDEIDLKTRTWKISSDLTKNAKSHEVHLSGPVIAVLSRANEQAKFVFSRSADSSFQDFSAAKRELDRLSGVTGWRLHDLRRTCVSGMARLGIAPHVADKILNHQAGTISGVAAVYQRHDFLAERREALETWVPILGRSSETKTLLFESLLDQFCCMSLAGLCGNPIFPILRGPPSLALQFHCVHGVSQIGCAGRRRTTAFDPQQTFGMSAFGYAATC